MKKTSSLIALLFLIVSVLFAQSAEQNNLDEFFTSADSLQNENTQDSSFDDLDNLFNEFSDVDEPVYTEPEKKLGEKDISIGTFSMPVEFSGKFMTSYGAAFVKKDVIIDEEPVSIDDYDGSLKNQNTLFSFDKNTFENFLRYQAFSHNKKEVKHDATLYFDMTNYIYFSARPDKYLAFKGALKTNITDDEEAGEDGQNQYFYLYEMYFDYLFMNKIYITAGKKKSVWGNIRLFSDSKAYSENDTDALYTNILYDSRKCISGIVKVPLGMHTLTGVVLYKGNKDSIGTKNMSIAGSAEFVFKGTSINIFGRRFPVSTDSSSTDISKTLAESLTESNIETDSSSIIAKITPTSNVASTSNQHILGAEIKSTIFGFDIYGQSMARVADYKKLKKIISSKGSNVESLSKIVSTVGFYRLWTNSFPYFGINAEYQNIHNLNVHHYEQTTQTINGYVFSHDKRTDMFGNETFYGKRKTTDDWKNRFTNRIALYAGLAKLGPQRNMKFGIQWNHDFDNRTGTINPGFIISRVLPHCDLNIGAKYEYYDIDTTSTVTKYKRSPLSTDQIFGYTTKQTIDFAHRLTIGAFFTVSLDY